MATKKQVQKRKDSVGASRRPAGSKRVVLLVATRKGAFIYKGDPARRTWRVDGPHMLGSIVHHIVLDPRDHRTLLMAARTGHLGPTVFRSSNWGKTWTEAQTPPAFPKAPEGSTGRAVDHTFWLAPGHPSEPGVWYAGTSPLGLFRSEDGGANWAGVAGYNDDAFMQKLSRDSELTPDGAKLHSILIDPRDPKHMYVGMSGGGTFESLDQGASWRPLNKGVAADFMPDKYPEYGQDPHCMVLHPLDPDRLYQQNHCGIYRIDRPDDRWIRIGDNMPKKIGDIGFPVVVHPREVDTLWVFPMDGTTVWPRTSPGGRPAVYRSRTAGRTWERQDKGLPRAQAWFTVKRQAFTADARSPVGLYFGTTGGEIWMSTNEGAAWRVLAAHLPHIYSVTAVTGP